MGSLVVNGQFVYANNDSFILDCSKGIEVIAYFIIEIANGDFHGIPSGITAGASSVIKIAPSWS